MKYIFLLTVFFFAKTALAQQTGEFMFQTVFDDGDTNTVDTIIVEVYQTQKKFAATYAVGNTYERLVVDSIADKVVELTDIYRGHKAYVTNLAEKHFGYTSVYNTFGQNALDEKGYRLLTEKKTIQGWECQKIEILSEGTVIGSGWLVPGLHIGYHDEKGFFHTKEGTIIEYELPGNNAPSLTLILIKSSKTITDPAKAFSLEVPAGYESDEE